MGSGERKGTAGRIESRSEQHASLALLVIGDHLEKLAILA